MHFVSVHVVHQCSSIDTATAWKKKNILLDRSDFHMIINRSIAVHTFAKHMLMLFSVDEILLPRYVNLSTNFRGLPLRIEIAPSCLKHMYSVLFAFTKRPMPSAACSRLCSRDSAWADVFASSARHLHSLHLL